MEDTLDNGTNVADNVVMNDEGSNLRHMFTVGDGGEPFKLSNENNKRVLTVDMGNRGKYRRLEIDCDAYKLSDMLSDIDEVHVVNGVTIECNKKGLKEQLCGSIVSDAIAVRGCQHVADIDFTLKRLSSNKYLPYLQFLNSTELRNCKIEFEYEIGTGRVIFNNYVPEFNNVSSNTVQQIEMDANSVKNNLWDNQSYKNLFTFPYTLEQSVVKDGQIEMPATVKINNIKDLKKLVTNKRFYGYTYSEWPVKLIPGAKLSDFIDISQFKSLYSLKIGDTRMGILFVNTNHPSYNPEKLSCYRTDMIMDILPKDLSEWLSLLDKAPITADGYKVIVYRKI
jgi:hypothetical protein